MSYSQELENFAASHTYETVNAYGAARNFLRRIFN